MRVEGFEQVEEWFWGGEDGLVDLRNDTGPGPGRGFGELGGGLFICSDEAVRNVNVSLLLC